MRAAVLVLAALATGCGTLIGIDDFGPEDPVSGDDDPGPVPASIQLTGSAAVDSGTGSLDPAASQQVAFVSGGSIIAVAQSGIFGEFVVEVPTGGSPVDGYLEVSAPFGMYQPRAYAFGLATSVDVTFTVYTDARMASIASSGGASQSTATGAAFVRVVDSAKLPIAGATITIAGAGQLRYHSSATGLPTTSLVTTDTSGAAWIFAPGSVLAITARVGERSITRTLEVPAGVFASVGIRF
jgi:hypothetical protein